MIILHGPFKKVISLGGLSMRGPLSDSDVTEISDAGILTENGKIIEIGNYAHLQSANPEAKNDHAGENMVVMPGFIDAHTHLCWAKDRVLDYALRVAGKSYLEIAEAGGGIWSSVLKTREASDDELIRRTVERAQRHLNDGITTIEVKSGYGLSVAAELKLLHAINEANKLTEAGLIPTCLAAHMKPRDFQGTGRAYLEVLLQELLPQIKSDGLANRIDIFIEKTAFNPADSLYYLQEAGKMGFDITVHADQFSVGGSEVGIEVNARSVDHLEASGEGEISLISASETTAVALPGASLGLGMAFTPARNILDKGGKLAIASDWNPGSAPMGDLVMQASVLGTFEKLTIAETLAGITFRAADALGLADRGKLEPGEWADMQAYDTDDYRAVFYQQGRLKPSVVWKSGRPVTVTVD
ncbi:imidazolonepropionase [Fulvivirga sedimenti]|uniref:Imidazolonepropionase n=1 Tax=Fulvivirga sedimenti TaxID=2879465 RepID=A0A9X1KUH6_9BACT|nr:imidazolonepropionase [Fulvivirga sedimenti]MCA6073518.1 imidazolonepropionase [Fulvivirga sedimenti]